MCLHYAVNSFTLIALLVWYNEMGITQNVENHFVENHFVENHFVEIRKLIEKKVVDHFIES
jgi:hypothetical protein